MDISRAGSRATSKRSAPSWTASGHDVACWRRSIPTSAATAVLHRGARPQVRAEPEWLIPLGPTIGWPSNGAVSNLAHTPHAVSTLRRSCGGDFDVVHLHEPVAPVVGWDALTSTTRRWWARSTATRSPRRRTRSRRCSGARRKLNHLSVRIAVSEAAAWIGRRFYGGTTA